MATKGPETRLVEHIRKAIKQTWPTAWIVKIAGGQYQTVGIPDLLVTVQGRLVGLEVKAQRRGESAAHAYGRTSGTQRARIASIRQAGGVAGTVLSVEEALELIRTALPASTEDPKVVL